MKLSNSKNGSILLFAILVIATFIAVFGTAVLISMNIKQAMKTTDYASAYDLNVGESRRGVLDKWYIEKHKDNGVVYLTISNRSKKEELVDYLSFVVYDTPEDAKNMYDNLYIEYEQYAGDKDDNWFTFWVPGVCDAEIIRMYYLEENIIISADIEVLSAWAAPIDQVGTPSEGSDDYDRETRKNYIIDNASSLRAYIHHDVLEIQ